MASIHKKRTKRPIPDNAEIVRSKKIARWVNGRGRKQQAKLSEDGKSIVLESSVWYARYRDHNDIEKHVSTECRDKQAAKQVLADLIAEEDKIRSGIVSAEEVSAAHYAKRLLGEHIEEYLEHLANKTVRGRRTSPVHVANVNRQLERLIRDCRFRRIHDITKGKVAKWMNRQAAKGEMSGRTINTYRAAIVAFVSWLISEDRLVANPLEKLHTADETEKRKKRRSLTATEIARVLDVARIRPLQDAMTIRRGKRKGQMAAKIRPEVKKRLLTLGYERTLIYECMIYAGLRRNELATLTVDDLHLDAKPPFVRLKTKNSKNALGDEIPMRVDVASRLQEWISCKLPGTKVFNVPRDLREILYRDLRKAGIQRVDDQGRQIDVHALRHTCGTQLAKAGVSPQMASEIMRHSSLDLTLKHYTHLTLNDTSRAVEMLPDFKNHSNTNGAVKTGTDGIEAPAPLSPAFEKRPEIRPVFQSLVGIPCPPKTTPSKQAGDATYAQMVVDKKVGSVCPQKSHCPGLESNQHEPKLTSPSS